MTTVQFKRSATPGTETSTCGRFTLRAAGVDGDISTRGYYLIDSRTSGRRWSPTRMVLKRLATQLVADGQGLGHGIHHGRLVLA